MSDNQEKKATEQLAEQLQNAGPVDNQRADAIAQEEAEDIDAFLADLESDDSDTPAQAQQPAADDPFAAAFADLESEHGDDVALPEPTPEPPKAKAPTPEQKTPKQETKPEPEPEPKPEPKADEKKTNKRRGNKKDDVAVVEKVRSPGFKFFMGTVKFSIFFIPAMLCWWLIGAYSARFFETGWITAILATLVAFILPAIARFGLGRGKYGWWALGIAVVIVGALVGGLPRQSGESLAKYGHWPVSTVAQLAKWKADATTVTLTAKAAEMIGQPIQSMREPVKTPATALAMGTDETLEAFAKKQQPVESTKPADKKTEDKKAEETKVNKTEDVKKPEEKKVEEKKVEEKQPEAKKEEKKVEEKQPEEVKIPPTEDTKP